ncbi:MAG: hypothetical protein IJS00_06705 [Paludibacteraceae bacterium]|nr:hypothetical protein [Paludibacteraceae bacterium]
MKKTLLCFILAAAVPAMACAKKSKTTTAEVAVAEQQTLVVEHPEWQDDPVITEDCKRNVSLVHENVKSKQFEAALNPWMQLYNECPNANKSIYTNGAKIVDYFYAKATDEAEKEKWARLALEICDKRIKYFGDDPKYPTAYILGEKGVEYCEHFPNDPVKEVAYPWLKESVEKLGIQSKITVMVEYVRVSYNIYKQNPDQYGEQFIADYTLVSGYLQKLAENPALKNASAAAQQKDNLDNLFAASGAAECGKLDELYANYVQENQGNMDNLLKVIRLYKRVDCTESDVYFSAALAAHKLQPTEESAAGCARMCEKKEDWKGAIDYYNEAISLVEEENDDDLDDYTYKIALINYDKFQKYMEARTYARKSLEYNPAQGRCYILIGLCYANARPYTTDNYPAAKCVILNKTVYWAAVDKFVKAKEVDPSCTEDANKLISSYRKSFPTKEEMFDLPNEFNQGTFVVGGWINETTVCRAAQ